MGKIKFILLQGNYILHFNIDTLLGSFIYKRYYCPREYNRSNYFYCISSISDFERR